MVIEAPAYHCFFCSSRFSADPEVSEGRFLHGWKVAVCRRCLANSPRVIPAGHPSIPQLESVGVMLRRDAQGNVFWPEDLQHQRRPPHVWPPSSGRFRVASPN